MACRRGTRLYASAPSAAPAAPPTIVAVIAVGSAVPAAATISDLHKVKESKIDNEQIEGIGQQVRGAVKRAIGKMIGDAKMAADGAAEETSGEAQVAAAPSSWLLMGIDADRI